MPSVGSGYDFRISPADILLADSWVFPIRALPDSEIFRCTALEQLPEDTFEAHGSIWMLVLAYMVLNRSERREWQALDSSPKRRLEWLMGRIAAKDAVRMLLRDTAGLRLCPADVEITADAHGALEARGKWMDQAGSATSISISHTRGVAIAMAGRNPNAPGIGVDVEQIGRITEEIERLIFSGREQELFASLTGPARAEWATRLWCAKEAVGKALGWGMLNGPDSLEIREADLRTGKVDVSVASPGYCRGSITAYTCSNGNYAFGTAAV